MNRRTFSALALVAAAGLAVTACSREPQLPTSRDVIDSNTSLSTLAVALSNAGVQSLDAAGPFTVFAPRNSAFDALPEGALDNLLLPENQAELTRLMQLHVVPGTFMAADLVNRTTTLTTSSGLNIIVDGFDGIDVGGVAVVQPDIVTRNGVIHILDGIIVPEGIVLGE